MEAWKVERLKVFLAAVAMFAVAGFFLPFGLGVYSNASKLSAGGVAAIADVTNFPQEEVKGRRGSSTTRDVFTLSYGDDRQYQKEVTTPVDAVVPGPNANAKVLTYDDRQIPNPQVHILYLAEDPMTLMAGDKGDSLSTLLSKNSQWLSVLAGFVDAPIMIILGALLVLKGIRSGNAA